MLKNVGGAGTIYWYGAGGSVLGESDLNLTLTAEYIFFNGRRLARIDNPASTTNPSQASLKYYLTDHLGSTSMITDATFSTILEDTDYYPYGREVYLDSSDSNHYKFTGKERDAETGNDYFGARYYASTVGRFLTADWGVRPTTVPYATFGDPQSLNLYGYVRNDPITRIDLDGHQLDCSGQNAKGVGCMFKAMWDNLHEDIKVDLSYLYVKTGNGTGFGVNGVKLGPLKVDIIAMTRGKEAKHTTHGKTITDIDSKDGIKVELGPAKVGIERTVSKEEGKPPKTEWLTVFEKGKFEGSNGEVGVGFGGCFLLCGKIEGGIQADKLVKDLADAAKYVLVDQPTEEAQAQK